jgi:carboxyl-terminal processing protease
MAVLVIAAASLAQTPSPAGPKTDPIAYLNLALDQIQGRVLRRSDVDWPRIRSEALTSAKHAQSPVDTYEAIRFALTSIGDHHSVLRLTPALQALEAQRNPKPHSVQRPKRDTPRIGPFSSRSTPEGRIEKVGNKVFALVVVPKCSAATTREFVEYETKLQHVIADLDRSHPGGWIVDLRGNSGGNMWPMLAGIGPVLGESEHLGESFTTHGQFGWSYHDGMAAETGGGRAPYPPVDGTPYKLAGTPSVAVLIDDTTTGLGEAIAMAFRGRPKTRFFGEHTAGFSTITETIALPDGAALVLTTGIQADRNGKEYLDGLDPDELIRSTDKTVSDDHDEILQGALWWLSLLP